MGLSVLFVLVFFLSCVNRVELKDSSPSCAFPAIYNFGDSNSDTGGISAAFLPIPSPYGEGFFHKPSGRDSDGRVILDFIVEKVNLPYLSAYLNSLGTNYRHGANFATGGSTIRKQNETIFQYGISPFSLDIQIVQFSQFKARTKQLYQEAKDSVERSKLPVPEEFAKALYTFDIGQNDLSVGFRKMNFDQIRATMPDIVNQLASAVKGPVVISDIVDICRQIKCILCGLNYSGTMAEVALVDHSSLFGNHIIGVPVSMVNLYQRICLANFCENIYEQGGRSFWIHNTGPIGCLPVNLFYKHSVPAGYFDPYGCVNDQNVMAVEFNKQLKDRVVKLRTELPEAAITYVDVYAAKYGLISNTKNEGFVDPMKICCGYHVNDTHIWCGNLGTANGKDVYGTSCEKPSTYVSWDGVHYAEAANHWVANRILNGTYTDPPTPISQACYRH